jgi:hypothetical protein
VRTGQFGRAAARSRTEINSFRPKVASVPSLSTLALHHSTWVLCKNRDGAEPDTVQEVSRPQSGTIGRPRWIGIISTTLLTPPPFKTMVSSNRRILLGILGQAPWVARTTFLPLVYRTRHRTSRVCQHWTAEARYPPYRAPGPRSGVLNRGR